MAAEQSSITLKILEKFDFSASGPAWLMALVVAAIFAGYVIKHLRKP